MNTYGDRIASALDHVRNQLLASYQRETPRVQELWIENVHFASPDGILLANGAGPEEIDQLRELWGGWMPAAYEAFLTDYGRTSGWYLDVGINCNYPLARQARQGLDEWLMEMEQDKPEWYDAELYRWPDDAIPIGHHSGVVWGFFCERSDDPHITLMTEAHTSYDLETPFERDDLSFSNRVIASMEAPLRLGLEYFDTIRKNVAAGHW